MTPPNMKNPIHFLAFGMGSGLAPKAPGTFGTLAALPFWWFLLKDVPTLPYLAVILSGFSLGVLLCEITSRDMGLVLVRLHWLMNMVVSVSYINCHTVR